ncbi:MAG TPA: OmpA family protein [Gallionella sp.]|nr:OmpA family protein [Gallionella sp.]
MKRTFHFTALLCSLAAAHTAIAHPNNGGYLTDSQGGFVHTGYGACVRTAEWTTGNAVAECDPDLSRPAAAKIPPAATPAAAPVVTAAPAPAQPQLSKIELSADESFESGKAELKPEAKAKLGKLVKELQGLDYDKIVITGHADRTGSKAGNQQLSERRANAVHNYLVSEGVADNKMSSSGKGSSQPITKAGDCAKLKGKPLAACLAPDRRVEIRISGTRSK